MWQGRIVSDSRWPTASTLRGRPSAIAARSQRIIRTLPRKGFRFVGEVAEETADTVAPQSRACPSPRKLALPDQPSLVVLPFTDMSPKQNEEHFADGITEDLITELARIRWLFVIARNSAFVYKDRPST